MNPSRRLRVALVLIVSAAVLVGGCRPAAKPTLLTDPTPVLGKEILYVGLDGNRPLLLSPAEGGKLYLLPEANKGLFARAEAFSVVELRFNQADQALFLSSKVTPDHRNVPVVAAADHKAAANAYPVALLERFLHSGYSADYAIAEYRVVSSKVTANSANKATVEIVADLRPADVPLSPVNSRWGEAGADGWVRGRRLVLDLYCYGGQYCSYRAGWSDGIFSEGAPPVAQGPRDTAYQPTLHENIWQALDEGKDVEDVIWEDETFSYISHVKLRGRAADQYYDMTIYRIERATGDRFALFDVLRDCWTVRPLGLRGSVLYLQTGKAMPFSEAWSGPLASLDLQTGEYTVLLTEQTAVLGSVGDVVYVAKLVHPDGPGLGGIYGLNPTIGELKRISNLPGPSFSTAYEYACLMYSAGGKLYVWWPDHEAEDWGHALYTVDPQTGAVARVR